MLQLVNATPKLVFGGVVFDPMKKRLRSRVWSSSSALLCMAKKILIGHLSKISKDDCMHQSWNHTFTYMWSVTHRIEQNVNRNAVL